MRFGVLGPLEVRSNTSVLIAIAGAKERQLLAVLIAAAPRVVAVDGLLEALWEGAAPPTARKSLQAHVVRLRTALEPTRVKGSTGQYVVRRGAGYALTAGRQDIDTLHIQDLAARGRALLASDPTGALDELIAARRLWRGEPYADWPDSLFADAERRQLHELLAGITTALVQAKLTLGRCAEVVPELQRMVTDQPFRESWWCLLMLAYYQSGRQADALAAARTVRALLAAELGAEPGPELCRMEVAVLAQDPALDSSGGSHLPDTGQGQLATGQPGAADPPCPYKGLSVYQAEDAPLFYGRSRLVNALLARLADAHLMVVSGPSGAGKSSVVRAGLVPALQRGALPGSGRWTPVVLTPGAAPVDALAQVTGEELPPNPALLVCDQLEELWAPGVDSAERAAFLDAVLGLLDDGVVARCVVVLRGDHLGRLAEYPAFAARADRELVLVPAPTETELREVVCGPAESVGLVVEPELVDAVVAEVWESAAALPLLSTALVGTWERRRGTALTLAGYLQAGGVAGALTRYAEAAFAALGEQGKRDARALLIRLADLDDGGVLVRRRVPLDEAGAADPGVRQVVDAFVERRLLTIDRGRLEVTHEALLTAWPRLARWLEDDAAGRAVRRHLAPAALEWDRVGRPVDELYRGPRLAAALDRATEQPAELTAVELAFLAAAEHRAEAELRDAHDRVEQERTAGRRARRLSAVLAGVLAAALLATGLAVTYQRKADVRTADAFRASTTADANRLAALSTTVGSLDVSLLLAAQAVQLASTAETQDSLLAALVGHRRVVRAVPFRGRPSGAGLSGDGRLLVVGTSDQLITWAVGSAALPRSVFELPDQWQFWRGSDVSADGVLAAAGWRDDTPWVRLVDPEGRERVLLEGVSLGGFPVGLAFSPDGRHLLVLVAPNGKDDVSQWSLTEVAVSDGSVRSTGVRGTFTASPGPVGASFTDDTAAAVVWSGDAATLVPLDGGAQMSLQLEHRASPSLGLQVFRGGVLQRWGDGTVTVYDRLGRQVQDLAAHQAPVADISVSLDGRWAVTAGDGGVAVVWDIDVGTGRWSQRDRLLGQSGDVVAAKIDPTGRFLYTVASDGTILTWDMSPNGGFGAAYPGLAGRWIANRPQVVEPGTLAVAPTRPVTRVPGPAGAPEADTLSVAATFFDPVSGRLVDQVVVGNTFIGPMFGSSVALSPDRRRVAVTSGLATTVLDTHTRAVLGTVVLPAIGDRGGDGSLLPAEAVWCAGWTPDGSRLLLGAAGIVASRSRGALVVVNASTWQVERRIEMGAPQAIELSPDNRVLAVALADRPAMAIVDATSLAPLRTVPLAGGDYPYDLSFAPDGRRLAVGGDHGLLHVFDTESWSAAQDPAKVQGAQVTQVEWLADNRTVVTAGLDGTVALYDVTRRLLHGRPLPAAGAGYTHVLTGAGDVIALSGERNGVRYPLEPSRWMAEACAVVGRNLTAPEWARYLPRQPYRQTCGHRS